MSGRVTESAPTPNTGISGAILHVVDGPAAGRIVTADQLGFYTLSDILLGVTVSVRANGYLETTKRVDQAGDAPNFQLMPLPITKTTTMSDTLSERVGACSDGTGMKPCHILTLPIHNAGPLDATLTWSSDDDPVDLDLALFKSGGASFISRAASRSGTTERISVADVPPGALYELRVTYASGTEAARYTLKASHQN